MKTKTLITLLFISTILFSCKKDGDAVNNDEKKDVNPKFTVEVDASSKKSDNFALYYSEDGTTDFKDMNTVWCGINGGGKLQKVKFELSEEKVPTHIRLDLGLKKDQDSVVIKNVKVSYYGNSYEFIGSDFFKYFIQNDEFNTKVDVANGTLTVLQKDGIYKSPYYYPTQATIDNIKKITTAKKE